MNIYALSSGKGPSGIAIVRVSGKDTLKVCNNLTKLKKINSNEVNYFIIFRIIEFAVIYLVRINAF